jgi:phosphate-selective porin OprO/OprP
MRHAKSALLGLLSFPPKLFLVFSLSACLCFLFGAASGWAQEPSTIEERLLRMEREMQMLRQKNEQLEDELSALRQKLEARECAAAKAVGEVATEPAGETQHADTGEKAAEVDLRLKGQYKNGFVLSSEDGQYKLKLGGRITGRFTTLDSDHPSSDEFSLERARIETDVSLLDHYALRIQVEFSEDPKLKDGYLDIHYVPWASLRLGQYRPPFTWENLQSHKYIDFAERSIAVNNMRQPSRDIGLMLHGGFCDDLIEYQLAVLNGTGENKGDDNDAKDLAGRLVLRPFQRAGNGMFSDLHLGVSGTWGDQNTDFSSASFKTTAGTQFVDFTTDTMHKGNRTRLGTELVWPVGPASLKAEWMRMWLDNFQLEPMKEDLQFYAWYVSGSYLLTGETKPLGRVVPNRPFDPSKGAWGAWEVAARYSTFHSDRDLFDLGMAAGADRAEAFTIGLNWYLNRLFRVTFNYEHTEFDDDLVIDGKTLDDEDALLVQCQLEF